MKNLNKIFLILSLLVFVLSCGKKEDKAQAGDKTATEQGAGADAKPVAKEKKKGKKDAAPKDMETPVPVVGVFKPVKEVLQRYVIIDSNVESNYNVSIMPEIGGKFVRKNVKIGDYVTKGRLIGYVDPSKPGLDYNLSAVYATATGTITKFDTEVGDTVTTSTVLGIISDIDQLLVKGYVAEKYVGGLKLGLPADISSISYPDMTFQAKVTKIFPVLDPVSRTIKVEMTFIKKYPEMKAGMFSSSKLYFEPIPDVLQIPAQSILIDNDGNSFVFVASGTKAMKKIIKTGIIFRNRAEILEGITVDDPIIVSGIYSIADGVDIKSKDEFVDLNL